jgi:hypothetical protein
LHGCRVLGPHRRRKEGNLADLLEDIPECGQFSDYRSLKLVRFHH